MKKSLIAVAALAAAGAVSAQSSVTLFGTIDTNAQMIKAGSAGWTKTMGQNGYGTSQLSVRGSEELGGGLKAIFLYEGDFEANSSNNVAAAGATGNTQGGHVLGSGGGEIYVGLAGAFGSVKLGTPNSPTLSTQADRNPFGTKAGSGFGGGGATILGSGIVRQDKSIRFDTASFSGFSLALDIGDSSTGANIATANGGKVYDVGAFYANGPISAGVSHWEQGTQKINELQASYTFGPVKVMGGFHKETGTAATAAGKGGNIAVTYNLSPALAIDANYAKLKTDVTTDNDPSIFAIGPKYMLSKRTTAYARYVQLKSAANIKTETVLVGIRHNF